MSTGTQRPVKRRANDPSRRHDSEIELPYAEETEREVLGLLMMEPVVIQRALEAGLSGRLFQSDQNRALFSALQTMHAKGKEITAKTIIDHLKQSHMTEKVGGVAYVASMVDGTVANASRLVGLIANLSDIAYKRDAVKKAERLREMAGNGATPAEIEEFLDSFERTQVQNQTYAMNSSGLVRRKPGVYGVGVELERLANFGARITRELIEDDGSSEEQRIFEIEVSLKGERRMIEVPASKFSLMAWPTAQLGAEAIIYPGKADHARCAIQSLSPQIAKKTVYAHSGWREIEGQWSYLHSGGAITPQGNRHDVSVRLPHSLRFFLLPEPAQDVKARAAGYKAALGLLKAFPMKLTVPVLGAVWAALLGDPDYSVYVTGQSGCFKSEMTGIAQSFFGAGFNRLTMPANWDDTANAIGAKSFTAKDAILCIDDFAPNGQKRHDEELHAKAERVFRAAGNRAGKGRLQSDMTERVSKEPRGMLISSGEDLPRGMSLQARLLIVPIEKGEIKPDALTIEQRKAAAGEFAQSTSVFVSYLASRYMAVKNRFADDRISFRDQLAAQLKGHSRQPTTTAHLAAAWRAWLVAAHEEKAISTKDAAALWKQIWALLTASGHDQKELQGSVHPVDAFINLLRSVLVSGRANLQTIDGDEPQQIGKLCGWRNGQPAGNCVGWIDEGTLYLEIDSAYGAANEQGYRLGEGIAVTKSTLVKRLDERGLILFKEPGRGYKTRVPKHQTPAIAIPLSEVFTIS